MSPSSSTYRAILNDVQAAAKTVGIEVLSVEAQSPLEIESWLARMVQTKAEALACNQVIDGREVVKAHGTCDMPVWGNVLAAEGIGATRSYSDTPIDMEVEVRSLLLSLVDYLNRIQVK